MIKNKYLNTGLFYTRSFLTVSSSAFLASQNKFNDQVFCSKSCEIVNHLSKAGINIDFENLHYMTSTKEPFVIIGNHMSVLETFILPSFFVKVKPISYVLKQSLLDYPVFGRVARGANPIPVNRTNPREDFKTIIGQGVEFLNNGISVIIFPQTTRSTVFKRSAFNSMGIKLAKKANCAVLPLALKTDAWGNGRFIKDYGFIDPSKPVRLSLGAPINISGNGRREHAMVTDFISRKLRSWNGNVTN